MTPDQHRARAEQLAATAEKIYTDINTTIDQTAWRHLDTTIRLGQLHAALAALPAGPSFTPTYETLGPDSSAYGDGEPTHDRK